LFVCLSLFIAQSIRSSRIHTSFTAADRNPPAIPYTSILLLFAVK